MAIVFDIETVGFDFDSLTDSQKEYLLIFSEYSSKKKKSRQFERSVWQ